MHRLRYSVFGLLAAAAFVALISATGCGPRRPKTIHVEGVVTLDGKPVQGAAVLFSPVAGGHPADGITDAQGKFTLTTFAAGDGALPGEHAVAVTLSEVSGVTADPDGLSGEIAPGGMKVKWIVPQRYSKLKTSGLTVTVDESMPQPARLALSTQPAR